MPFTLPTANKGGDAPKVEDGLAVLRFDDLLLKPHEDWAGTDKFGKADDGNRYHFLFTLMSPDGKAVQYAAIGEPGEGDPIELEALTRTATGEKSNFAAILGGILTASEMAAWQAATEDDPWTGGAAVQGRLVNAKIAHNKREWPFVEAVIGAFKVGAKKTKAELQAEAAALLAAAEAEDGDEATTE